MSNVIRLPIENCLNCPEHLGPEMLTMGDSFRHDMAVFCKQVIETEEWRWLTTQETGEVKYKLIAVDDREVEKYTLVPDWCPYVLESLERAMHEIENDPMWNAWMKQIEDWSSVHRLGRSHARELMARTDKICEVLNVANAKQKDKRRISEKERLMIQVIALLYDLGVAAGNVLSRVSCLTMEDKMQILSVAQTRNWSFETGDAKVVVMALAENMSIMADEILEILTENGRINEDNVILRRVMECSMDFALIESGRRSFEARVNIETRTIGTERIIEVLKATPGPLTEISQIVQDFLKMSFSLMINNKLMNIKAFV